MERESIKLELIDWIIRIEDQKTIQFLKSVKDSSTSGKDWWAELPDIVQEAIKKGLEDVDNGRVIPHEEVKKKYGL